MEKSKTAQKDHLRNVYKDLEDEHGQILALVGRAKNTAPGGELLTLLEELHAMLQKHFARESYPGGFYESMGACEAEHADELRVLVDEHFRILSRLWSVIESTRRIDAESTRKIADGVVVMSELLEAHERKEHALAERLLN